MVLARPRPKRELELKRILERAKSIGIKRREPVALEPVFDNAIKAMQLRLERQQNLQRIMEERRRASSVNDMRRNKVVEMEGMIQRRIKEMGEQRMARIRESQLNSYYEADKKLRQESRRLRLLEGVERSLIVKLGNTKSIQSFSTGVEQSRRSVEAERGLAGKLLYMGRAEADAGDERATQIESKRSGLNYSYAQ